MLKEDFVIQVSVRRLLARTNIDYSGFDFGSVKGVVYFRGIFRVNRSYSFEDPELSRYLKTRDYIIKTLYSLEKRVKGINGVKDVVFQFSNWEREHGQWVQVKAKGEEV